MKAFPELNFTSDGEFTYSSEGMDLRDYFAAKAEPLSIVDLFYAENPSQFIESIVKKPHEVEDEIRVWIVTHTMQDLVQLRCKYRYLEADAMMKAREK